MLKAKVSQRNALIYWQNDLKSFRSAITQDWQHSTAEFTWSTYGRLESYG